MPITSAITNLTSLHDALFSDASQEGRIEALLGSDAEQTAGQPFGRAIDRVSFESGFPFYSSKWSGLQVALARAPETHAFNSDDPNVQSALSAVVKQWIGAKRLQEYKWLTNKDYRASFDYDRAFFDYCRNDNPQMAALWAWVVKSTPEAEEYIRARHPEYIPRIEQTGMIPQFGWLYYTESQGFATQEDVSELFHAPAISAFIGRYCTRLGHHNHSEEP